MRIDLHEPLWAQSHVVRCTHVDDQTLNNYINHGHASPKLIASRRRFTALQMIEIAFTAQLATFLKIPPHHGSKISRSLIAHTPAGLLENDAAKIGDKRWVARASYRGLLAIRKAKDGSFQPVARRTPTAADINIVFPVQLLARSVLHEASRLVEEDGSDWPGASDAPSSTAGETSSGRHARSSKRLINLSVTII